MGKINVEDGKGRKFKASGKGTNNALSILVGGLVLALIVYVIFGAAAAAVTLGASIAGGGGKGLPPGR